MPDSLQEVSTIAIRWRRGTYEGESVCLWIMPDILRQVSVRNPVRDQLRGGGCHIDTQKGDNVRMFQAFPRYSLFVEILWVFQRRRTEKSDADGAPS